MHNMRQVPDKKYKSIYFCHGLPGSSRDSELLSTETLAPELLPTSDPLAQFDTLTSDIAHPLHIVGFSIGARIACLIAANRSMRIAKLTLISPAAPLQTGDYLDRMAGQPVFLAAQKSEAAIGRLAYAQALATRVASRLLLRALFAKTGDTERNFASRHTDLLSEGLRHSLIDHRPAYVSHLRSYVEDWSGLLPRISCPTHIYHGTQDKWAPVAMAHALARAIPDAKLNLSPTEHYTTFEQVKL